MCKEVISPVLCVYLIDMFCRYTITFQDTDKGLSEDFQQNFVAACTIELSVQTLNILFSERVYILMFSLLYYTCFLFVVVFRRQSIYMK